MEVAVVDFDYDSDTTTVEHGIESDTTVEHGIDSDTTESDEDTMLAGEREELIQRQEASEGQGSIVQFASAHTQPTAVQRDVGALDESVVQMEKSSAPKPQDQLKSDGVKHVNSDEEDDSDDGRICSICMDIWCNSGNHRLSSLPCGHFFGYSCIMRWLQIGCAAGKRRCPQCNKKASIREIRVHYARKLQVLDTVERDRLREELERVQREKNVLELELARAKLNQQLHQQQLAELQQQLVQMQHTQASGKGQCTVGCMSQQSSQQNLAFYCRVEICREGGCRVLAYDTFLSLLVVSQRSSNTLFSGYGIKKIDAVEFRPTQFVFLHSKAIRDLAFHPLRNDILLSVSLDRSAKLFSVSSNTTIHSYTTDSPLWSCCWDASNSNVFFVGTSNGIVLQYDTRFTLEPVCKLSSSNDSSPVTSLAAVPTCPGRTLARGGFLACRLNSCWAYEQHNADYVGSQLPFDGPFVSLCYDNNSGHVLISTRPSVRYLHSRHILCQLPKTAAGVDPYLVCNPVHTFQGSTSQNLLSRPCQVSVSGDTLVAAHQESLKSLTLWSISSGRQVFSCPASQPVIDLCPVQGNSTQYLAALSEKVLTIYNFK